MGGIMSMTGEPGGQPVKPGMSLADIAAGLFTAIGILSALHERERSGRGQLVDVSMLDCQVSVLENAYARYFATGEAPKPLGTRHPVSTPFQAFPTADGHIVIALGFGLENAWQVFCALIGCMEVLDDPRFATPGLRTKNHAELEPILSSGLMQKTTAEWLAEFEPVGIPCGPLLTIPEAASYPQVAAREMLVELESERGNRLTVPNSPLKFSRTPTSIQGPPPVVGRHTREVLSGVLGMSEAVVEAAYAMGAAVEGEDLPEELTGG
jgi:CoA:oxalate CoA-transferase